MNTPTEAAVAKAAAHPVRLRVLRAIIAAGGEGISPTQVAAAIDLPVPNVSYHVRKLEDLGFVTLDHEARRRGASEHYFRALFDVKPQAVALAEREPVAA